MASWVIGRCVITGNGQGGFITSGLSALVNYVIEHNLTPLSAFQDLRKDYLFCRYKHSLKFTALSNHRVATSTAFITITVCNSDSPKWGKEPGNTDPAIAEAIGQYMHGAAGGETTSSEMKKIRSIGGQMWELASTGMLRSSSTTWWLSASQSSAHDEMTYECDTSLGSPVVADCAQVEWNQLGPPSDTLTVGPQNVHFLHSSRSHGRISRLKQSVESLITCLVDTCFVAISASVAILLDWNQVRTAVSTIMNICIQNPIQPSQGGRAYYKSASRTRRRDNRPIQITGSNALPPNTNITIFQQQEPWTNPTEEMLSCTWEAVQNRSSLTKCLTA